MKVFVSVLYQLYIDVSDTHTNFQSEALVVEDRLKGLFGLVI